MDTLIEGAIPANLSIAELASLIYDKKTFK